MKTKFCLSLLTLTSVVVSTQTAIAQTYQPSNRSPVADSTLGTQVSGNGNNFNITGGVNKGQTLFHSFTDFSVPTNGQANFLNPVGNRDIITRVTGNVFSDINGTVNTNGANFFLINPNGIVFGTNAQLNVGKAFVGSTANSIDLVDAGGRTITFGTNANGDAPLLSVTPNVLFNASRLNMGGGNGQISNFGTLQTNNPNQYIGLIGGNVELDGGQINAPSGRVELGGLSTFGSVALGVDGNNLTVQFPTNVARGDVSLTNGARVNVAGAGDGDIDISARNLEIFSGSLLQGGINIGLGTPEAVSGDIKINVTGELVVNSSEIGNVLRSNSSGRGGNIRIDAGSLSLLDGSVITTTPFPFTPVQGQSNAGNIDIKTTGDIKVSGYNSRANNSTILGVSQISSNSTGQGDAGKITIDTQGKLSLVNQGIISSNISQTGVGNSPGIKIKAREAELSNDSYISTDTFQIDRVNGKGNAGNIDIETTGDININLSSFISSNSRGQGDTGQITINAKLGNLSLSNFGSISSALSMDALGNGRGIKIEARELKLTSGSSIFTNTFQIEKVQGKGNAGDIQIDTTGNIKISGSAISSTSVGEGDAGKISINTELGKLSLVDGGVILSAIASPLAVVNGKGIKINANELEIANQSSIQTAATNNTQGNAGDIDISTTGDINIFGYNSQLTNPSVVAVSGINSSSFGEGEVGNISIETKGKLFLANQGVITAVGDSVTGGNIKLVISDLLLLKNFSSISTDSGSRSQNSSGGNISIDSPLIIATPGDNNISANAYAGTGGRVNITTQGLFGIQYRLTESNFTSDITASSTFGQNGTVNIETPGTDPGRDSTELPNTTTDASNQISQVCSANNRQNKLTVTGRGGLPPNANDPLTSDVVWQDARAASSQPAISSATNNPAKLPPPAVGWVFDGKGKVTLIAAATPGQPTGTRVACPQGVSK
jgi:filamentous hemagglutinin family protein